MRKMILAFMALFMITGGIMAATSVTTLKDAEAENLMATSRNMSKENIIVPAGSELISVKAERPFINYIANVVYEQVPMRGYDNVAMKMDLMVPQKKEKMPAILYITGGGFINANKDSYIQPRMDLAEAGYVVASMEYRVAPTVQFPKPLEDVKAAVRYLRSHAEQYHIDANKIGILGGSAGGYLAAMVGTTNGQEQFDVGENLQVSSDVQAVVDTYGLSDLTRISDGYPETVREKHMSAGATEALWVNGSPVFGGIDGGITANRELTEAANPIHYISDKTPPFLLMHGSADTVVSPNQTVLLQKALQAKGIHAERYVLAGAPHGGVLWIQPKVSELIIEFFNKTLKN